MVEKNSPHTVQQTPQPATHTTSQLDDKSAKPYSAGKQTAIVLLITLGILIGLPFLLFMTCLGVSSLLK